jgi:peptide/nickel transport system permease protein
MFGLIVLIILVLSAIFADKIAPYHFDYQDLNNTFALPSLSHLMGTDNYGRDIFSRILYGSRISLMVGCISVVIGLSIGGLLGVIAAYYGGVRENIIMRFIDIMMAISSHSNFSIARPWDFQCDGSGGNWLCSNLCKSRKGFNSIDKG